MIISELKISVRSPWWKSLYMGGVLLLVFIGYPVDVNKAASFLARHVKVKLV